MTTPAENSEMRLPSLSTVREIQSRLALIFPEEFPDRGILTGIMAARVIFVFLYGGFVEGAGRFLRPSHVYLFTEQQSLKTSEKQRLDWLRSANRPGQRTPGRRWYADTSREPIRDDLMRNQLLRLGVMRKRPGFSTTASTPINYITGEFAALFNPAATGEHLNALIAEWRLQSLSKSTLQRMALRAKGVQLAQGELFIEMPDGTRIRVAAGPSSEIARALIERFTKIHLEQPAILWLSGSDTKAIPQFVAVSESVGLTFDLSAELPDLILADMTDPLRILFCEIVATDGAVTEARREALLRIVRSSNIPEELVEFLSAFDDRQSGAFRKNFGSLAVNSLVWFRTEPELLVVLQTKTDTAQEFRTLKIIGDESERQGTSMLTSRQIDRIIRATRAARKKKK